MKQMVFAAFVALPPAAASAQASFDRAFELCSAQPVLQPEILGIGIDEVMSQPHDPSLDSFSREELLRAAQHAQATKCARLLSGDEELFDYINSLKSQSKEKWNGAWVAYNSVCQFDLTATCVRAEVEAGEAIRMENAKGRHMTPASRVCQLVMTGGLFGHNTMSNTQWKNCMDQIDNSRATDDAVLDCAGTVTAAQGANGREIGTRIAECINREVAKTK